jgi:uncharacterized FlaG/YvyC family protein
MSEEWREDVRYIALKKHIKQIKQKRTEAVADVSQRGHIRQKRIDELDALAKGLDALLKQIETGYHTQLPLVAEVEGRKAIPRDRKKGD